MPLSQRNQAQTGEATPKMCDLINIFINTLRKKVLTPNTKSKALHVDKRTQCHPKTITLTRKMFPFDDVIMFMEWVCVMLGFYDDLFIEIPWSTRIIVGGSTSF